MKNPLTPAGIEIANFRIVAQHLNQCATAVKYISKKIYLIEFIFPRMNRFIEPVTFRFVAQHLNHCATAVKYISKKIYLIEFIFPRMNRFIEPATFRIVALHLNQCAPTVKYISKKIHCNRLYISAYEQVYRTSDLPNCSTAP